MWYTCQQALQSAYKTGVVGDLFQGAAGVWPIIGTHLDHFVYVVKDLGELEPGEASVLYVHSDEAKLPEDAVRMGMRETPDPDEYLYMKPPGSSPLSA